MTSSLSAPSFGTSSAAATGLRATTLMDSPRLSRTSLAGVALAHAAVLAALLLSTPSVPKPVTPPRPITVSLVEQPTVTPDPQPEPEPVPPKPQVKPLPPPPVLIAKRPAPSPQPVVEAAEPEPLPEPLPEVLPPVAAPVVAEAPKPAPPPPPQTPPRQADYLNNPKPPYPALSRRLNEEGIVRLNILVNPDGTVARLEIAKSSGYPRLDDVARKTVQSSWKFEPALQAGKPVSAWVIVPIHFTLRS